MRNPILALPCSFLIALLVAKMALVGLHLPIDRLWLSGAVLSCMLLLYKRNLPELGLIAVLATLAESQSATSSAVSPDVLLAVLFAIIVLPATLELMGLAAPKLGPLLNSN
jgi:hypothetical protein